jgi:hypothetical protein
VLCWMSTIATIHKDHILKSWCEFATKYDLLIVGCRGKYNLSPDRLVRLPFGLPSQRLANKVGKIM